MQLVYTGQARAYVLCLERGSGRSCYGIHSASSALEGLVSRGKIIQDSPVVGRGRGGGAGERALITLLPPYRICSLVPFFSAYLKGEELGTKIQNPNSSHEVYTCDVCIQGTLQIL